MNINTLHVVVFLASIICVYFFKDNTVISMLAPELTAVYIALANLSRKEVLPPLLIIIAFKVVEFPVSLLVFTRVDTFLITAIAFDVALIVMLLNYHNAIFLRRWLGVKHPIEQRYLPQIKATTALMMLGLLHYLAVLFEYWYITQISPPPPGTLPFFYETFGVIRSNYKVILVLAIWSIMVDAIWLRKRLAQMKKSPITNV